MKTPLVLLTFIFVITFTMSGCQEGLQGRIDELTVQLEDNRTNLELANAKIRELQAELSDTEKTAQSHIDELLNRMEDSLDELELANSRIKELQDELSSHPVQIQQSIPATDENVDLATDWTTLANQVGVYMVTDLPQYNPFSVYVKSTKTIPDRYTQIDVWLIEPRDEATYYQIADILWKEFSHSQDNGLFVHAISVNGHEIGEEIGID